MFLAHAHPDELGQISRGDAHRFAFVAEALPFARERVSDVKSAGVCLADCETEGVV
jgi:hypothetical protein